MIDKILELLQRYPNKVFELSGKDWDKSSFVIAGATHLPRREQLNWWADYHDLNVDYNINRDVYRFSKRNQSRDLTDVLLNKRGASTVVGRK